MVSIRRTATALGSVAVAAVLFAACSSGSSSSTSTTMKPTTATTGAMSSTTSPAASTTSLTPYCPPTNVAATQTGTKAIGSGGTETDYSVTTVKYSDLLSICQIGMTQNGWTVTSSGGGGANSQYGGGGLSATKGSSYAAVEAGSGGSTVYLNVCVWPSKPADTNCGNNNQNNN